MAKKKIKLHERLINVLRKINYFLKKVLHKAFNYTLIYKNEIRTVFKFIINFVSKKIKTNTFKIFKKVINLKKFLIELYKNNLALRFTTNIILIYTFIELINFLIQKYKHDKFEGLKNFFKRVLSEAFLFIYSLIFDVISLELFLEEKKGASLWWRDHFEQELMELGAACVSAYKNMLLLKNLKISKFAYYLLAAIVAFFEETFLIIINLNKWGNDRIPSELNNVDSLVYPYIEEDSREANYYIIQKRSFTRFFWIIFILKNAFTFGIFSKLIDFFILAIRSIFWIIEQFFSNEDYETIPAFIIRLIIEAFKFDDAVSVQDALLDIKSKINKIQTVVRLLKKTNRDNILPTNILTPAEIDKKIMDIGKLKSEPVGGKSLYKMTLENLERVAQNAPINWSKIFGSVIKPIIGFPITAATIIGFIKLVFAILRTLQAYRGALNVQNPLNEVVNSNSADYVSTPLKMRTR